MAWTPDQLKAIQESGSNIIVSAGAGSGKTAVLTTRVLEKLNHGIHINELLILTFTNAAAAEMKERIKKNIEKENLSDELELIDASYITTFDSFALSLVKKYHYLLNIPKNITITDASIITLQKKKILADILERFYQEKTPHFCTLIDTLCVKDDEELQKNILALADKLNMKTDLEDYLKNYLSTYYNEEIEHQILQSYTKILENKIEEIFIELEDNKNYFDTEYESKVRESLTPLKQNTSLDEKIAIIKALKIPASPRGSEEETKEAREKINTKLKECKAYCNYGSVSEILEDYNNTKPLITALLEILTDYFQALEKYKQENYIFDFTDIAKLSLKLIKENTSIKEELKETFKEIMVDEYQDTSDIQEEFISLISNHNVYMVGDIKQSIYRFRNANPYIFKEKYDKYKNGLDGMKIDLLKNFRSRSEVLDNINIIFNKVMDDEIGNADYTSSHQMVFGNTTYIEEGKTEHDNNMIIYTYNTDSKEYSKEEIEIFAIAKDILEKIEHNYPVLDKNTNTLRPVTYKDFCIIMDRNSTFDLTKKIFEFLSIPLSLYKDEELNNGYDIYIIKNILNLLIHLKERNFNQEFRYSLVSIARSFLYQIPDEEILTMIKENIELQSKIVKDLSPISQRLDDLSPREILMNIIDKTNYYEKLITTGNIKESILKMEKIIELASTSNLDIYEFKNYLDELLNKNELIKFNVGSSSSNAVRIMNIHKSKGLEFPICYFAGLYKSFSKQDLKGDIIYVPDMPIYIPIWKEGVYETILKLLMKDKMTKEDISEKIRLFYVALTRAKEKMILFLPNKELLEERKTNDGVILKTIRYKYSSLASILYSIPSVLKLYREDLDLNTLGLTKDYMIPKEKESIKETITPLNITELNIEDIEIKQQTFSKKMNKLIDLSTKRNIEFGNTMHELLEHIDLKNPNLELIKDPFMKSIIEKLLTTPLLQNRKDAEIYQEYEFIEEKDGTEYHGKIDLMLVYDNHIDIIDYKLDNVTDEAYINQLNGYKTYIENHTEKKVNTYLFSLLSGTMTAL